MSDEGVFRFGFLDVASITLESPDNLIGRVQNQQRSTPQRMS